MAFRVGGVLGLICSHPVACISVLLLFTPPLFPITVYFSPLLISTALVVLAMVSMGSHVEPPRPAVETEVHYYRRAWIEEVFEERPELEEKRPELDEERPELEEEKSPKSLKAATPKGDRWLRRMKSLKSTGPAWMESVLSQKSDASLGNDQRGPGTRKKDSRPFLSAAKELFSHESKKQKFPTQSENQEAADSINQSPLTLMPPDLSEIVDSRSGEVAEASRNTKTEITPQVAADGGSKGNSSESGTSSPLFRSRTASRREADGATSSRDLKVDDMKPITTEDSSKSMQIVLSSSAAEKGKQKDLAIQSAAEESHVTVAPGKKDEAETSNKVGMEGGGKVQTLEIVPVESQDTARTPVDDEKVQKTRALTFQGDEVCEKKSTTADCIERNAIADGTDIVSDKTHPISPPPPPTASNRPSRLATELPGQGKAPGDADSPSAAVALSEKLKVPLADILSLLTGDDKKNAKPDSGSEAKAMSSSDSTTSQEEDWSSSDGETTLAAPGNQVNGGGSAPGLGVDGVGASSSEQR